MKKKKKRETKNERGRKAGTLHTVVNNESTPSPSKLKLEIKKKKKRKM